MPKGGKRKGAGRKTGSGKYGEPTTPVRIPVSLVDIVLNFVKKLKSNNENTDKKTSN